MCVLSSGPVRADLGRATGGRASGVELVPVSGDGATVGRSDLGARATVGAGAGGAVQRGPLSLGLLSSCPPGWCFFPASGPGRWWCWGRSPAGRAAWTLGGGSRGRFWQAGPQGDGSRGRSLYIIGMSPGLVFGVLGRSAGRCGAFAAWAGSLSRWAALRVVGLPGAAGRWRSFHGSGLISGQGPVVSSCPARRSAGGACPAGAELIRATVGRWASFRASWLISGDGGPVRAWWDLVRSWGRASGLILAGPAARAAPGPAWGRPGASGGVRSGDPGPGAVRPGGAAGGRVCRGVGRHFTPLANFPGPILILPC